MYNWAEKHWSSLYFCIYASSVLLTISPSTASPAFIDFFVNIESQSSDNSIMYQGLNTSIRMAGLLCCLFPRAFPNEREK
jgi:hypothetical protein